MTMIKTNTQVPVKVLLKILLLQQAKLTYGYMLRSSSLRP